MVVRGLALAIPSNVVERFVNQRGRPARRLGITVQRVSSPSFGLLILEVEPESTASTSGLQVGDVLTGVGGKPFEAPFDLAFQLEAAGSPLLVDVSRGGQPVVVEVEFEASTVGAEVG
jgi:S1-C subfamily serine protease